MSDKKRRYEVTPTDLKRSYRVERLVLSYRRRPSRETFQAIYSNFDYIKHNTTKFLKTKFHEHRGSVIDKTIRRTFKAMLQKYSPKDENSRFEGWVTKYFWKYADTEMGKEHKKWLDSKKTRHGALKCFEQYSRKMNEFQKILDALPKREKQVMFAYYHDRLKIKFIAQRYGISESTVRSVKMVALKKIEVKNHTLSEALIQTACGNAIKNHMFLELKNRASDHFR